MPIPRAVIADQLGPLENYSLREHDPGAPGAGEVRIAIRAAGVSFVDVLNATGKYQGKAPVPFIPGSEFAGVIEALGSGVSGLAVGQPVLASHWGGAFAEAAVVSANTVTAMAEGMAFDVAAVFRVSVLTAWHALVDRGQLQAGETLLVLGAGGATGYAAVQIGKYLGAHVIASATSEEKRAMALVAGADAAVDARSPQWRELVKDANQGKAVDVVFDPVGGDSTEPAFRSLAVFGRHLVVGFARGMTQLPTNLPLLKGASLVGVNLQQWSLAAPEQAAATTQKIMALGAAGKFWPVIAKRYPLAEFATAMNEVAAGKTAGRVVLLTQS
ncbi:NADPH:quinone oxidoreductase family protein [Halioxenophilus sp. WMMB6]|uniref:NADPH:quinone oxidoreductase family protein n=1 Tax=Halioxenophilus sp. WMMB6 TaxID=3073815 RepID=UPI00295EA2DD|nr:NADPH:quinone oxidoreductase family protein [Halioxenophilus sp. WMMB6]